MKHILFISIVSIFLYSCEPSRSYYTFKIVNKTNYQLNIESKSVFNVNAVNIIIDKDKEFIETGFEIGCYKEYQDSLISHFFKKLNITCTCRKSVQKNIFNKSSWQEHLNLTGLTCRKGESSYTLIINDSDLK